MNSNPPRQSNDCLFVFTTLVLMTHATYGTVPVWPTIWDLMKNVVELIRSSLGPLVIVLSGHKAKHLSLFWFLMHLVTTTTKFTLRNFPSFTMNNWVHSLVWILWFLFFCYYLKCILSIYQPLFVSLVMVITLFVNDSVGHFSLSLSLSLFILWRGNIWAVSSVWVWRNSLGQMNQDY